MPELPEVETVIRSVQRHLIGQVILRAELTSDRVTRLQRDAAAKSLENRRIERVRRLGKQIFLELDEGTLYMHLGMTGNLLWEAEPNKYTRAILYFASGKLLFNDIRQFGRVEYFRELPAAFGEKGPDALALSPEVFFERLQTKKGPIKPLLLNQAFVSGVGNIYADEALFAAGIHPKTRAKRISRVRAARLHAEMQRILVLALEHRGSSIANHVDACGEPGAFQHMHAVYSRGGKPCLRCNEPIRRIVLGQRSTHYCPRCQRV